MDENQDASYGVVMPFVSVQSKGGPHEDGAFAAGFEMGALFFQLGALEAYKGIVDTFTPALPIHTVNVKQADLIAMHFNWKMFPIRVDDSGEWTSPRFTRMGEPLDAPDLD